ncbi:MAG: hypothetical protein ABSA16_14175, partial [Thermoguttaceae bacterium]
RPRGASGKETTQEELCCAYATSATGQKTFDENNLKPRKCHWGVALAWENERAFGPKNIACYVAPTFRAWEDCGAGHPSCQRPVMG